MKEKILRIFLKQAPRRVPWRDDGCEVNTQTCIMTNGQPKDDHKKAVCGYLRAVVCYGSVEEGSSKNPTGSKEEKSLGKGM